MAARGARRGHDAVSGGPGGVVLPRMARGTSRAPLRRVRLLTLLIAATPLAATALAAAPAAAHAQIAGVLNPPRVHRPARGDSLLVSGDSATRAGRTSAATPAQERSRLDIQAWVDSAAGALARSAPTPIPPPGSSGRPSIFATPAVPDSLRPPPAPTPSRASGARRTTRRPRP